MLFFFPLTKSFAIEEKTKENWLRYLGDIKRPPEAGVRNVDCMIFSLVKNGRRRSRRTFKEVKRDLMVDNISKGLVFNLME